MKLSRCLSFPIFMLPPSDPVSIFFIRCSRLCYCSLFFSIPTTSLLIVFLKYSQELRDFCGFDVVWDASKFTRFKQDFLLDLQSMFDHMVDMTEPICQKLKAFKKAKGLDNSYDPYKAAHGSMPSRTAANPAIQQMYVNGHFCYAYKFGIITNGLGIVSDFSAIEARVLAYLAGETWISIVFAEEKDIYCASASQMTNFRNFLSFICSLVIYSPS